MLDLIGNAAGIVWKYLDANGETSVAKLAKETKLDTKLVQRALGWLASEDKLTFIVNGRTELFSLK
jgi:hypothetical protein